jgi:PAS domain-containing protein
MSMLELREVSKVYGEGPTEVHAISEVELSVDAGALVAVMGAAREQLRGVIDSLLDPWVLLGAVRDQEGRIVDFVYLDANDAACRMNRRPRDQLLGSRLLELLPSHRTSGLLSDYAAVVETGEPLTLDDFPYPTSSPTARRDGSTTAPSRSATVSASPGGT